MQITILGLRDRRSVRKISPTFFEQAAFSCEHLSLPQSACVRSRACVSVPESVTVSCDTAGV